MQTRRRFLTTTASGIGAAVILPYAARAAVQGSDTFQGNTGAITVHPIHHASFVMQVPGLVIYNDPVGKASAYAHLPPPDLILLTHHHKDHYVPKTLAALVAEGTKILANPTVYDQLPKKLKAMATSIGNGDSATFGSVKIEAVPAYNYTEGRTQYHPKGRDNGYVVNTDGRRIYIAGDTEDVPEMLALTDIDIAFLPMILPYTMDITQAAFAVGEFFPAHVYPYHYGKSDIKKFDDLVKHGNGDPVVHFGPWYT